LRISRKWQRYFFRLLMSWPRGTQVLSLKPPHYFVCYRLRPLGETQTLKTEYLCCLIAVIWLKYCQKRRKTLINQSINQSQQNYHKIWTSSFSLLVMIVHSWSHGSIILGIQKRKCSTNGIWGETDANTCKKEELEKIENVRVNFFYNNN
jgi:hypothetical protein